MRSCLVFVWRRGGGSDDADFAARALASTRSWHGLWWPCRFEQRHQFDHKPCQDRVGWKSAAHVANL